MAKDTLFLVVGMQNDFITGGLAVPQAEGLVGKINESALFFKDMVLFLYSQDWHPENHKSFYFEKGDFPPHCIAGSKGANFHAQLFIPPHFMNVKKGMREKVDEFSTLSQVSLIKYLKNLEIKKIILTGLTLEYGILNTVIDSQRAGFETIVLKDLVLPLRESSADEIFASIESLGATIITSNKLKHKMMLEQFNVAMAQKEVRAWSQPIPNNNTNNNNATEE